MDHRDHPGRCLEEAAEFLDPLLETRYDRWENRRKDFDLLCRLALRFTTLLDFLGTSSVEHCRGASPEN